MKIIKYSNLYYKFPQSRKQKLSNDFIIEMCFAKRTIYLGNTRKLEDWARGERKLCLDLLLLSHPNNTDLTSESQYIKDKSVPFLWDRVKEKNKIAAVQLLLERTREMLCYLIKASCKN